MRKVFMLAAVVAAAASVMAAGTASAGPATIVRVTGILWFDGNGAIVVVPDADVQYVYTNNANGNVNIRITGTLPDGSVLPTKAQQYTDESTGFFCSPDAPSFKGVTTPSGQFSFECKAP